MWENVKDAKKEWKEARLPCAVKLLCDKVIVYTGAGYEYVTVGSVTENDRPVITEVREGKKSTLWGNLKSGAGWIPLAQADIL